MPRKPSQGAGCRGAVVAHAGTKTKQPQCNYRGAHALTHDQDQLQVNPVQTGIGEGRHVQTHAINELPLRLREDVIGGLSRGQHGSSRRISLAQLLLDFDSSSSWFWVVLGCFWGDLEGFWLVLGGSEVMLGWFWVVLEWFWVVLGGSGIVLGLS